MLPLKLFAHRIVDLYLRIKLKRHAAPPSTSVP